MKVAAKIIVFIIIIAVVLGGGVFFNQSLDEQANRDAAETTERIKEEQKRIMSDLTITDLIQGTGPEAKNGGALRVHYVGTFADGSTFDSSYDRGEPLEFTLGEGAVIRGWDLGLLGMRVGGKRKLVIPPELAYDNQSVGPIPANSTLYFTVELVGVR